MDEPLRFSVNGMPIPQGSMRNLGKGRPMVHDNDDLLPWRDAVGWSARGVLPHRWSKAGGFTIAGTFYLARPAYLPKTVTLPIQHKNDLDKLTRAIMDALKNVVYNDDGQVTGLYVCKRFGTPHVDLVVERAP